MNPPTPRILSCGEILWDLFPDGPRFGGAPANFAAHASLLGASVSVLSAVGQDTPGQEALGILKRLGIDTALIQETAAAPTGTVLVSVDSAGKPDFTIQPDAAWDRLEWSPALRNSIADFDAVYFGTLGQRSAKSRDTIRRVLETATDHGILRVLDINLRPPFYDGTVLRESLSFASVLKLSDEELPAVAAACAIARDAAPAEILAELRSSLSLNCVLMTRGANGAVFVAADETIEQAGFPVTVVDTVGAGDAFTAAFVTGLLRGQPVAAALRRACEIASGVCAHAGAIPSTPNPVK
jgi:fructokinase